MKKTGKRMRIIVIATLVIAVIIAFLLFFHFRSAELVAPEVQHRPAQLQVEPEREEQEVIEAEQSYVENQVLAIADSKHEAKKIANEIGGELISYDNQVAVIQIGVTVEEMMQRLEEDSSLPKVYPNYQNYTN